MKKNNLQIKENNNKVKSVKKQQLRYYHRIMIKYAVAGVPIQEFADKFNIPIQRCRKWLRRPDVLEEIELQTKDLVDLDAKKRKKRIDFLSSEVYSAILDKITDEKGLSKVNIKNLMKMFMEFNKEIRNDNTIEQHTGRNGMKITVELNEELSKRYLQANSARQTDHPKIIDITQPKQIEEHQPTEVINGIEDLQQEGEESTNDNDERGTKLRNNDKRGASQARVAGK